MAKVHIKLSTIKRQLQQRMHYPTEHIFEDDDFLTLDEAFDVLPYGFGEWCIRHSVYSRFSIYNAINRGWFTEQMADYFTDYCISGWRII